MKGRGYFLYRILTFVCDVVITGQSRSLETCLLLAILFVNVSGAQLRPALFNMGIPPITYFLSWGDRVNIHMKVELMQCNASSDH